MCIIIIPYRVESVPGPLDLGIYADMGMQPKYKIATVFTGVLICILFWA